jgi:hypothetical protein
MEEKTLTTEQSLDIISKMLIVTRRNFNDRGGAMFLIWGYTTFFVSLVVLLNVIEHPYRPWLWCALPITGGILTLLHYRKYKKPITTHLDKAVGYVWIAAAAAALVCVALDLLLPMRILTEENTLVWITLPTLFIIVLLGSMATAATGLIIKFPPVAIGGLAGIALSFLFVIYKDEPVRYLLLPALLIFVWIVPGHLLNRACKREARNAAQNGRAE